MPATVIVGAQWGDEGKGKIVDLLAQNSDFVCRYQGGPNAGHTIVRHGETFKLHHVPSGILYGGKICVVGAGCVIDPGLLVRELDDLEERGISTEGLRISGNAHLIMPWHVASDSASERRLGKLQIGTTRRGIGPAYADKAARLGIRVQDILDAKILRQKFETALAEKNRVDAILLRQRGLELLPEDLGIEDVLHADAQARGLVSVRGPDPAASGADLELSEAPLARGVGGHVPRHDQVRVSRDAQALRRDPALLEIVELADE